jgi:D-sedoheptulose 7-phosphate isomerase
MMEKSQITQLLADSIAVKTAMLHDESLQSDILALAKQMVDTLQQGGRLFFAGNGGSFADSIHLAAEFVVRFETERQPLAAMALGTNGSALTAAANDYAYERIFARELEALAQQGDVFVGLSTSGNSANIVAAAEVALQKKMAVFILTGEHGGQLGTMLGMRCLSVPSNNTARVQESHITIGHIVCHLVEQALQLRSNK